MVDDEPLILKSLKRLFRSEPYRMVFARTGAEGMALLAEIPHVAVIISDQCMPHMTGTEFLSQSKMVAPDAVRMLMTGETEVSVVVAAMNEAGASQFICKPWKGDSLRQVVRDAVRQFHLRQENLRQHEVIHRQHRELLELLRRLSAQNAELERLAATDALTGLANRRRLFQHLEGETTRAKRYLRPLSLIMLDIDHFKQVNDTWGHAAGDAVLKAVSGGLGQVLRETDLAARSGGEEFVLLLPETDLNGAVETAERLLQMVSAREVTLDSGQTVSVTVSLGVTSLEFDESGEDMLLRADQAMYRAKRNGRNQMALDRGHSPIAPDLGGKGIHHYLPQGSQFHSV